MGPLSRRRAGRVGAFTPPGRPGPADTSRSYADGSSSGGTRYTARHGAADPAGPRPGVADGGAVGQDHGAAARDPLRARCPEVGHDGRAEQSAVECCGQRVDVDVRAGLGRSDHLVPQRDAARTDEERPAQGQVQLLAGPQGLGRRSLDRLGRQQTGRRVLLGPPSCLPQETSRTPASGRRRAGSRRPPPGAPPGAPGAVRAGGPGARSPARRPPPPSPAPRAAAARPPSPTGAGPSEKTTSRLIRTAPRGRAVPLRMRVRR